MIRSKLIDDDHISMLKIVINLSPIFLVIFHEKHIYICKIIQFNYIILLFKENKIEEIKLSLNSDNFSLS